MTTGDDIEQEPRQAARQPKRRLADTPPIVDSAITAHRQFEHFLDCPLCTPLAPAPMPGSSPAGLLSGPPVEHASRTRPALAQTTRQPPVRQSQPRCDGPPTMLLRVYSMGSGPPPLLPEVSASADLVCLLSLRLRLSCSRVCQSRTQSAH